MASDGGCYCFLKPQDETEHVKERKGLYFFPPFLVMFNPRRHDLNSEETEGFNSTLLILFALNQTICQDLLLMPFNNAFNLQMGFLDLESPSTK